MVVLARTDLLEIPVVFVGLIIVLDTTLFFSARKNMLHKLLLFVLKLVDDTGFVYLRGSGLVLIPLYPLTWPVCLGAI